MFSTGRLAGCCLLFAAAVLPQSVPAQTFPARPVRIVVPFPAGGTTDIIARLVAQRMSETIGQPVVVENRGGAGGSIGADAVAKAAPDGYTILMHNITFPLASIALAQANRAPYNIDTDFAGISIAANVPLVITAHPSVPANNLREFVALLQNDKSLKYNYGSTGPGSYMNIVGEVIKRDEKIDMAHIPLKGAAPLKQELLAGRLQLGGDQLSSSLAEIRKGALKALATNAPQRLAALPEVPTVRELGFPKLEAEGWNGLFAPAKTPRAIVMKLNREIGDILRAPETQETFLKQGVAAVPGSPEELGDWVKAELARWTPIIQATGIKAD